MALPSSSSTFFFGPAKLAFHVHHTSSECLCPPARPPAGLPYCLPLPPAGCCEAVKASPSLPAPLLPPHAVEFYNWYGDLTRAVGPLIASQAGASPKAKQSNGGTPLTPRRMNAFELLNCCSAVNVSPIFDAGEDAGARHVQVCGRPSPLLPANSMPWRCQAARLLQARGCPGRGGGSEKEVGGRGGGTEGGLVWGACCYSAVAASLGSCGYLLGLFLTLVTTNWHAAVHGGGCSCSLRSMGAPVCFTECWLAGCVVLQFTSQKDPEEIVAAVEGAVQSLGGTVARQGQHK